MSMGGHQSAASLKDEWLTPPSVLIAMGEFDLDPCSPINRPWDTAKKHYTVADNGLAKSWVGRVWCNPPYGLEASRWLARCAEHKNAIALVFARTETRMFFEHVWPMASGLLFLRGRLHFHHVCGKRASANAGAPSVLIAYNKDNAEALSRCGLNGQYLTLEGR